MNTRDLAVLMHIDTELGHMRAADGSGPQFIALSLHYKLKDTMHTVPPLQLTPEAARQLAAHLLAAVDRLEAPGKAAGVQ